MLLWDEPEVEKPTERPAPAPELTWAERDAAVWIEELTGVKPVRVLRRVR